MTSGATGITIHQVDKSRALKRRTPVRAPDDCVVARCTSGCRGTRDTKVGKLYGAIFGRQDISALNVAVNDALIVQVHETLENLRDIDSYEILRKLSESFANIVQRTVLAESGG